MSELVKPVVKATNGLQDLHLKALSIKIQHKPCILKTMRDVNGYIGV